MVLAIVVYLFTIFCQEIFGEKQEEDEEVDVVSAEKIAAFCSSDEEDENCSALLYLPISPEIDEPEEGWGAPLEQQSEDQGGKRGETSDQKENTSPKKRRSKTYDVNLTNAPSDEVHPLLNVKTKDKLHISQAKKGGRPKSVFGSSSKSSDSKHHKLKTKDGRNIQSTSKIGKGDSSRGSEHKGADIHDGSSTSNSQI